MVGGQKFEGTQSCEIFGNLCVSQCMYYYYFPDRHINDTEIAVSSLSAH